MAEAHHWFEMTVQGKQALAEQLTSPDERDVLKELEKPVKGIELFRRLKMGRWDDLQKILARLVRRGWASHQDRLRLSPQATPLDSASAPGWGPGTPSGEQASGPLLKEDWMVLPTIEKNLDLVPPPLSATQAVEVGSFENESSSEWERDYQNQETLETLLSNEELTAEEALKFLPEDVLEGLRSATPPPKEEDLIPEDVPPGEEPTADNAMELMMAMGLIAQGPKNMLGVPKQALLQKSEERPKSEAKIGSSMSRPMAEEMSEEERQLMNAIAGRPLINPVQPKPQDFEVPSYGLKPASKDTSSASQGGSDRSGTRSVERSGLEKEALPKVSPAPKIPPTLVMPTPLGGSTRPVNNPVLDKQAEILARMQKQASEREAAAARAKARQEAEAAEKEKRQQNVEQQKRMEQVQSFGPKDRANLLLKWKEQQQKKDE